MTSITGWDIGGAHLKVARLENGKVVDVAQLPALIWTDLDGTAAALGKAVERFGSSEIHAVTMTGELAEIFKSRNQGVLRLTDLIVKSLPNRTILVYAGRSGFCQPHEADLHANEIASANWFASAEVVARQMHNALFVDIGSTTTDIVPILSGAVAAKGFSDAERLAEGELVYTGAVRTPVMAVASKVPFNGRWQGLMAERFAIMADIYRILKLLPDGADQFPAVDNRPKTEVASRSRLARMLGRDEADANEWQWTAVARYLADRQVTTLSQAAQLCLSSHPIPTSSPLIGTGAGSFIAEELALRLGMTYRKFADLFKSEACERGVIDTCAPAVSVAGLAYAAQ